jgi:anti-sigma B factor antagonist
MSGDPSGPRLGREDVGDVTVLRFGVPTLREDAPTLALFEQAYGVVGEGRARLVLNFDGVAFVSSSGLGRMVVLLRKAQAAGGRLVVCKLSRNLEEVLRAARLADIFLAYPDEQAAVRSFA